MKRLNKKGFTLVELLAVIVVLAVIMVIATQAIGGVIQKNTVDSFERSLDMVAKQAKTAWIQYGDSVTANEIAGYVDYDTNQFTISKSETNKVCITSVPGGKFDEMKQELVEGKSGWTYTLGTTTACKIFSQS